MSDIQPHDPDLFFDDEDATLDGQDGTFNGKEIWSAQEAADYLNRTGTAWGVTGIPRDGDATVINFGFFDTQAQLETNGYVYEYEGEYYGLNEYFGFGAFSEAQRAAAREAIQYWDDVVAISFRESSVDQADINFGNVMNRPGTQAYARLPSASVSSDPHVNEQAYNIVGDVWVTGTTASNFQFDEGLYGLNTLVHEFGHSLGLSHPGNYNFAPGFTVNYANGAEYAQDIRNYTIMSYWNPREVGIQDHDYLRGTIAYGATPMVHDILAIQQMYGADMTTRTGNTTYGFNSNAGRDAFDFTKTPAPVMAIWDAGGIDTLDASGYATNQIIDLRPGHLSSIGGVTQANAPTLEQVNATRAADGYAPLSQAAYDTRMANLAADPNAGRLVDNVGIAYGATIENAIGGSGNDLIQGNSASNYLKGNAGDDDLYGDGGTDILDGGAGADTLRGSDGVDILLGGSGADHFVAEVASDPIQIRKLTISADVILDFGGGDKIDFRGLDADPTAAGRQGFQLVSGSLKNVGDVMVQTFGNLGAATRALGIDVDNAMAKALGFLNVSVVLGNLDGDRDPEFAFLVLNQRTLTAGDFLF
ncbi:M10 family metallopeptidase [Phenylobacterium sp.]|uniref:M10 family metallopeptidase n=1 Tax=Phenylobacterium sp. TaxID=1871053 RepID=UPI0035AF272E